MPAPKLITTGRHVPRPKAHKVRASELPPNYTVHENPKQRGYHGPRETALPPREARRAASEANYAHNAAAQDRKWDRSSGKLLAATMGTVAAPGLIATPIVRHMARKKTQENRAKTAALSKAWKGDQAPFHAEDPGIRHATSHRGVHGVTSMSPKVTTLERLGRVSPNTAGSLAAGAYVGGMAVLAAGMHGPNKDLKRSQTQLRRAQGAARRRKAAGVAKRGPKPSMLREHFGTPRKAVATLGRNPEYVASGGALAVAGGAQARPLERRRTASQRDRADVGSAALAGGVAGQAGFRGAGYTVRHLGHKKERERPKGMSRSQHQKIMSNHYKSLGLRQNEKTADPKFYRTYPKDLPATPYKRILGQTSGKRGAAMLGAATVGGAYAAGHSVHGRKQNVAKTLYQRNEHLSPIRTAQMAGGLGLLAWGAGRSRFLGSALARGVKTAAGKNNAQAVHALQLALAAQGALKRGTAVGERQMRQVRRIDQAVRAVPGPLRPGVAMAAGAVLAGNSMPLTRTSYRPVSQSVRVYRSGW